GVRGWPDSARPAALVLDISMPGLWGLEASAVPPADGPFVIFVTAHEEHAVEAFELGAVDYVVKPVTAARLAKAIDRVRDRLPPPGIERVAVETRGGLALVATPAIVYARVD